MIWKIYFIILGYFVLGFLAFMKINRKKSQADARKNWIKYFSYFFIIHVLFISIVAKTYFFHILAGLLLILGFNELLQLFLKDRSKAPVFWLAIFIYLLLAIGFILFSTSLSSDTVLYCFLVISIFDSFSQLSGQLWGKKKLLPRISPGKTIGGVLGGVAIALISAYLMRGLLPQAGGSFLLMAIGLLVFAFLGDLAASWYKRIFSVKDFNQLIPGHGGVLDRFDSLIPAGACAYVILQLS